MAADARRRRAALATGVPAASLAPARVVPLLKWAGGKRQLLPALAPYYPPQFQRYLEPFLGSGAVFFDLFSRGLLCGKRARLSDVNPDLIGCYRRIRDEPEAVVRALDRLQREHQRGGDTYYYAVRDRRFNPQRAALWHDGHLEPDRYTPELAAMLIFLNRTGFNGLFRLNRRGAFNVPAGRYARPQLCDVENLRAVAAAFRAPGVSIEHRPFLAAIGSARAGDFVYCDPPYEPVSRTANFANYTAAGFTTVDQRELQQAIVKACRRGAWVVLSNSSAPSVLEAYRAQEAVDAHLAIYHVPARRAINSRASARGMVQELIVTNVRANSDAAPLERLPARPLRSRRRSA